jgi:hypothetical protein
MQSFHVQKNSIRTFTKYSVLTKRLVFPVVQTPDRHFSLITQFKINSLVTVETRNRLTPLPPACPGYDEGTGFSRLFSATVEKFSPRRCSHTRKTISLSRQSWKVLPNTFWPIWRAVANLLHALSTTPGDHLCGFEGTFQDTYQPVQSIVLVHLQNCAHLHQPLVPQQFAEHGKATARCLHCC